MKKIRKRIPLVRETVFVLSLQSVHGGDPEPPFTTSVQVPTVSEDCSSVGEAA